jgi:hypothetical protein
MNGSSIPKMSDIPSLDRVEQTAMEVRKLQLNLSERLCATLRQRDLMFETFLLFSIPIRLLSFVIKRLTVSYSFEMNVRDSKRA